MTSPFTDWYQSKTFEARQDPRQTSAILEIALGSDEEASSKAIGFLHWRATREVFDAAVALLSSTKQNERFVGIQILAQLGLPDRVYLEESLAILLPMLETESDASILNEVAFALGHIRDPRAIEPLLKLKNYPHEDVRYGVVFGLLTYEDRRAVSALIELSQDVDEDVRNWATFGLAQQIELDTLEIREALYNRLGDEHNETRHEGMLGLGIRKDPRVIEPMIHELASLDPDSITLFALDIAIEIADPSICSALLNLKEKWANDNDDHTKRLLEAIQVCNCDET
jgi:HEAT repeat protein